MKGELIMACLVVIFIAMKTDGFIVEKRSAATERNSDDYPDYQLGVKYDEYPMIVPKKRTALLVDRLMVALQQAIDEEEQTNRISGSNIFLSPEEVRKMDIQRRGPVGLQTPQNGRGRWKCYFNAVTCF